MARQAADRAEPMGAQQRTLERALRLVLGVGLTGFCPAAAVATLQATAPDPPSWSVCAQLLSSALTVVVIVRAFARRTAAVDIGLLAIALTFQSVSIPALTDSSMPPAASLASSQFMCIGIVAAALLGPVAWPVVFVAASAVFVGVPAVLDTRGGWPWFDLAVQQLGATVAARTIVDLARSAMARADAAQAEAVEQERRRALAHAYDSARRHAREVVHSRLIVALRDISSRPPGHDDGHIRATTGHALAKVEELIHDGL